MSNTEQPNFPGLERGQIIPAFTLPGTDSMPHSPWTYKQREHLLLLFLHSTTTDEGRTTLQMFAQQYSAFRSETCAIIAITADPVITNLQAQETLHLPFPLVSDVQGNVIARYTRWENTTHTLTPSIVLADRYGALYEQWIAENRTELPSIAQILANLDYINRLCAL